MSHPVVFHNGRSVQFIAAWLLASLLPDSPVELIELDDLSKCPTDYLNERTIYFIGDSPTAVQINSHCLKSSRLVLIGYDTYGARGKVSPLLRHHSEVTIYPSTNRDILKGVIGYLRLNQHIDESWGAPLFIHELTDDNNLARADFIYRALACEKLTTDKIAEMVGYDAADILTMIACGKALNARHSDFINRALVNDIRPLDLDCLMVLGCGTTHMYASCLAEAIAKQHGIGAAYYDNAQYRHYELRQHPPLPDPASPNAPRDPVSLAGIKTKYAGVGNNRTMRFRVPRTHKLATI